MSQPFMSTLPAITAPLLAGAGVAHAFFTREGGVSQGIYASLNGGVGSSDDPAHVRENRARMAGHFGLPPESLLSLYQIHSPDVITVVEPWAAGERPRADAMVTDRPGLALAVSSADCGPLLFADPQARIIGAAHAGWKGAHTGVIEATIAAMEKLGATREAIRIVLGPTIGPTAYEVGPEFIARLMEEDAGNDRFFRPEGVTGAAKSGHAFFDLPAYIGGRVARAGISRFDNLALCTYSDPQRFFSYRRTTHRAEPDYGRLIAAITLQAG
jgi:YfiH family protein